MKTTISWCPKPVPWEGSPSGLSYSMPYLSFAIPSSIIAWSSDLVLPTALEQGCPSLGQWVLPGSTLASRVSVSASRFWLRRFGLGSEILHFNKLYRRFWCRWHGWHWETVWLREHSEVDWYVSILGSWFNGPTEGILDMLCAIIGSVHCLPAGSWLESDIHSTLKLDSSSFFFFLSWSSFGHILKSSTYFVMNPHLLVRRPSNGQTVCLFSATKYTPKNKKTCFGEYTQQILFSWST